MPDKPLAITTEAVWNRSGGPCPGPSKRACEFPPGDSRFMSTVVSRMDDNEEVFKRILEDEEFR